MNIGEMAEWVGLTKEQIVYAEKFTKQSKTAKGFYCDSCTGEWFGHQLIDSTCPMCLTEGELEEIDY